MTYTPPAPQRSVEECDRIMQSPQSPLVCDTVTLGKRRVRAYRNLPASIRDLWLTSAEAFADKEYLVYEGERLTYAQTHERVLRLASLLHARGVKKGDRVAIAMRNVPEWAISWWACHLLGGVAVAVNAWLTPEAFYHCVSITEPRALIVDAERAEVLGPKVASLRSLGCSSLLAARAPAPPAGFEPFVAALEAHEPRAFARPEVGPEDDAIIFFTSGTTSLPKGVLSTQRQYLSNRWNTASGKVRAILRKGGEIPAPDPNAPQASVLLTVPLFHVMGNHSFLLSLTVMGGKIVLMHKFSPSLGAKIVVAEGITNASGVPNQVMQLLEELPADARGVKLETLSYGGGPPSSRLPEEARKRLPEATTSQGYGLTEVNSVATAFAGDDYLARPTSCGLAPPAVDLKIIPPSAPMPVSAAPALAPGQVGEICIHGPNVAQGYWRDDDATRKAFDDEGWFRSGDLGYVDEEGFLFIADRAKDIV
ncbi:long-chain-fatty-acid-CoA ligase, partial [Rhodotorula diobovata]